VSGNFIKRAILSNLYILLLSLQLGAGDKRAADEDSMIVRALLSEQQKEYAVSLGIFLKLYHMTGKAEYLVQAAKESLMLPDSKGWGLM